jgi:hypothetical protein
MVEERKEIWEKRPTPRMVIPGKIGDGHLDRFLLEAVCCAPPRLLRHWRLRPFLNIPLSSRLLPQHFYQRQGCSIAQ